MWVSWWWGQRRLVDLWWLWEPPFAYKEPIIRAGRYGQAGRWSSETWRGWPAAGCPDGAWQQGAWLLHKEWRGTYVLSFSSQLFPFSPELHILLFRRIFFVSPFCLISRYPPSSHLSEVLTWLTLPYRGRIPCRSLHAPGRSYQDAVGLRTGEGRCMTKRWLVWISHPRSSIIRICKEEKSNADTIFWSN